MKFNINEPVRKKSGYIFYGIVKSRYEVEGGIRYDVQVDSTKAIADIKEMALACSFTDEMTEILIKYASNCHGMIHIFSEEQLELDV